MSESYDFRILNQTTAIKTQANAGETSIDVDSTTDISAEEAISIVLDDASVHWDIVESITDADTLVIKSGIPTGRHAAVDAVVKTWYAFMCRQEGRTKDFLITEAPLLPQTLITESASPSSIEPEREIQIAQVDWRKGFQNLILEDKFKYFESNCDARFKGMVILPPKKLSALSFPGAPTSASLTDGDLEAWTTDTNLTNWVETGSGVTKESVEKHSGTYAAKHQSGVGTDTGGIYQDISWNDSFKGRCFTFKAWGMVNHVDDDCWVRIAIDDGVGTTYSDKILGTSWAEESVTRKLDDNATRLRVIIEYSIIEFIGVGQIAYFDDAHLYGETYGGVIQQLEFGSNNVVAMGNVLWTVNGSLDDVGVFPATITKLCVYQDRLFIALGWDDAFYYTADLSTFTQSNLSNSTAKHMSNIGNAQFWISDSNNTMRDSDNPINGGTAFSSPYTVGSDDYDITGLVNHEDTVFVRKEDNVYYLSGSDVLALIPELASEVSTTYTYGLYYWKGCLYIGSGINSFYEYDISTGIITTISPIKYAPGDENYDGEILAICGDESYLYIVQDNGSDIKILAGRWETIYDPDDDEDDTDWYWHPLYDLISNDITSMLISAISGSKRMYLGTDTYSDGIIPFIIPVGYSAVYLEAGFECEASGDFITAWLTSNFPTELKYWKSVKFTSICITDKTSITPYYQKKGDADWTAMTVLTKSALGGGGEYPAETTDERDINVSSEKIRFKLSLAASDDDYTPILWGKGGGIAVFAVLQSERKKQIATVLQIAPTFRERNGSVVSRTVSSDLDKLRTLYQANNKMTVTGPDGTEYSVVFARNGYEEQLAYPKIMRPEIWWQTLRLLEV